MVDKLLINISIHCINILAPPFVTFELYRQKATVTFMVYVSQKFNLGVNEATDSRGLQDTTSAGILLFTYGPLLLTSGKHIYTNSCYKLSKN